MSRSPQDDALLQQLQRLTEELSDWLEVQVVTAPAVHAWRTQAECVAYANAMNRHYSEMESAYTERFARRVVGLMDRCWIRGMNAPVAFFSLEHPTKPTDVRGILTALAILTVRLESSGAS